MAVSEDSAEGNGKTILVVEDAAAIRKMVCIMLAQAGYEYLEAADGMEAMQVLETRDSVSLVLTDIVMPNMNGAELATHLARTKPQIRVMFMSGYSEDPVVNSLEGSGLFLAKPFTATALMAKIRQAFGQPEAPLE